MRRPRLGDTVYYITNDGYHRAATVTNDADDMTVNINVHKDGPHDWIGHSGNAGTSVVWLGDVPYATYSQSDGATLYTPHSWHWPEPEGE